MDIDIYMQLRCFKKKHDTNGLEPASKETCCKKNFEL